MAIILKTLLSYHWRNLGQSLFLLTGLVAGLALWVAVQVINETAKSSYQQASQLLDYQVTHLITTNLPQGVPLEVYARLRRAGYDSLVPVLERRLRDSKGRFLEIIATDLFALGGSSTKSSDVKTEDIDPGNIGDSFSGEAWLSFIQPPYSVYIPSELASSLVVEEGDQIVTREGFLLPPSHIITNQQGGNKLIMDVGAAMAVFNKDGFDYIAVTSGDQRQLALLSGLLDSPEFENFQFVSNTEALDLTQLTDSFHINLTAMSLLSLAVGLFIIYNAAQFSILYRRASIRTLRACGVNLAELGFGLAIEYLVWVIIGTIFGCGLGYWLGNNLLPSVSATLNGLYGASVSASVIFNIDWLWQTFLIAFAGMGLAIALPMRSLLFTTSINKPFTNQNELTYGANWQSVLPIMILLVLAWILLNSNLLNQKQALIGAFGGLAALLLAGTLILSKALMWFVWLGKTFLPNSWYMTRWLVSDIKLQLPRTRIAFMAILLALVANIGVNLMVNSFRAAFNDWIDYRLAADIYVVGEHDQLVIPKNLSGVAVLSLSAQQTIRWQGHSISLRGVDSQDPAYNDIGTFSRLVAETIPSDSIADVQEQWFTGAGVFINEQFRHKQGVLPGEQITLDTSTGSKNYHVLATLHDYGNTEFQVYLPLTTLKIYWPEANSSGWALMLDGTRSELSIIEKLENLGVPAERIRSQSEIKRVASTVFERTFLITAALNSLTLLIAGVSMLCALLALQMERSGFIGNLLSMGLHRSELITGMLATLLFKFTVTFIMAIPLGYILAWVLIEKINILSFGWTMPLLWQAQSIIITGLLAGFILILSAIPVLWLTRRKPLRHWLAMARYTG